MTWEWDWYQATIRTTTTDVQAALLAAFPSCWLEEEQPRLGYGEGYSLRDSEGRRAGIQSGGRNVWPNVTGSSADAPQIAEVLRHEFPDHEVTRIDSKQDFDAPDAWDRLTGIALRVADENRVVVEHAGDWHRGEKGRTLYFGGRASGVRVRIYEKGLEQRAKGVPEEDCASRDTIRVEIQVRPDGRGRVQASAIPPVAAWGFGRWSSQLLELVDGSDVPRLSIRDFRASNDARALDFMVKQYGAMLARTAGAEGMTWELLGARLGRIHERNEERKSR